MHKQFNGKIHLTITQSGNQMSMTVSIFGQLGDAKFAYSDPITKESPH